MTDLNFLDEVAPAVETADPVTESTDTPVTDTPAADGDKPEDKPKFTNVTTSFLAGDPVPDGYLSVSEFANELTVRNITVKGMGADGVVDKSVVYNAIKAVRHPLPVIVVGDTAYLGPDAFIAWDERPARGEGSGTSGGTLSDDDLFRRAADVRDKVDALTRRVASTQERLAKAQTLLAKRENQLSARGRTWIDVEDWVSANEAVIPDNAETETETDNSSNETTPPVFHGNSNETES